MDYGSKEKLNLTFLLLLTSTPNPPTNQHNAIGMHTSLCMSIERSKLPKSQGISSVASTENAEKRAQEYFHPFTFMIGVGKKK